MRVFVAMALAEPDKLTEEQQQEVDSALRDQFDTDWIEAGSSEAGVYFGWTDDDTAFVMQTWVFNRFPNFSWSVETDYDECDEPGKETCYFGPRRFELELADVQLEIARLGIRQCELVDRISKNNDNSGIPGGNNV